MDGCRLGAGRLSGQDSLLSPVLQKQCSSIQQRSAVILDCTGNTQIRKMRFLSLKSSWPNRKINMKPVIEGQVLLETRIDRIDTSHYAFKNERVEEADSPGYGVLQEQRQGCEKGMAGLNIKGHSSS